MGSCWVTIQIVLVPFLLLRMAYEVRFYVHRFHPLLLLVEKFQFYSWSLFLCFFSGSSDPSSAPSSSSPLAGKTVVVIGAGGAGKALAFGAKEKGAKVVIANRTYGKIHILNWYSMLGLDNTLHLFLV